MSASHDVSWCHMSVSSLCSGPTCQPFLFDSRAALPCSGNRCTTWLCLEPFLAAPYISAYPLSVPLLPPYSSLSSPFSLQQSSTSGSHSSATTKLWRPATSLLPRLNRAKNRPRLSPWQLPRSTASPDFAPLTGIWLEHHHLVPISVRARPARHFPLGSKFSQSSPPASSHRHVGSSRVCR
jgi:hypothetical protein